MTHQETADFDILDVAIVAVGAGAAWYVGYEGLEIIGVAAVGWLCIYLALQMAIATFSRGY